MCSHIVWPQIKARCSAFLEFMVNYLIRVTRYLAIIINDTPCLKIHDSLQFCNY